MSPDSSAVSYDRLENKIMEDNFSSLTQNSTLDDPFVFKHPFYFKTGVAYLVCFCLGTFLNVAVIAYLLYNCKKMILDRSSGIFIFSLALCDLSYIILAFLYALQHLTGDFALFGHISCLLFGADASLMHVNIWTTLGICVQRLAAIKWPFEYQQMFNRRRCLLIMGVIWVTACVIGAPMGYLFKLVTFEHYDGSGASRADCSFTGTARQFLATTVFIYLTDFFVPAILVSKYYWDFSKEVRRRARGVTVNHPPPAMPQNGGIGPSRQINNQGGRQDAKNSSAPIAGASNINNINNNISKLSINSSNVVNPNNNYNINSSNNQHLGNNGSNHVTAGNAGAAAGGITAHKFLQAYAGMVSISCWVCYSLFYNVKVIQAVDVNTGLHFASWIRPSGFGPYIERTANALPHLNSLLNPLLFIGLKVYMKRDRCLRSQRSGSRRNRNQPGQADNPGGLAPNMTSTQGSVDARGFKLTETNMTQSVVGNNLGLTSTNV